MNVLVLAIAVVALVSSALGIIVSVHSVKKLKLEIQNEPSQSKASRSGQIILPTLNEVVKYDGNARAYEAAQRAEEFHEGQTIPHSYITAHTISLVFGRLEGEMFRIPLLRGARLTPAQLATARRTGLVLQLSGIILWVTLLSVVLIIWGWPGILTLQFVHVVPLVFVFVILILLVPLLWTALWKSVMGA